MLMWFQNMLRQWPSSHNMVNHELGLREKHWYLQERPWTYEEVWFPSHGPSCRLGLLSLPPPMRRRLFALRRDLKLWFTSVTCNNGVICFLKASNLLHPVAVRYFYMRPAHAQKCLPVFSVNQNSSLITVLSVEQTQLLLSRWLFWKEPAFVIRKFFYCPIMLRWRLVPLDFHRVDREQSFPEKKLKLSWRKWDRVLSKPTVVRY